MQKERSFAHRLGIDILGYLCIVGSALTGWLPGPGGIPLLIIGLSLLATNHKWAEQILIYIKKQGGQFADKIFDGHPVLKWGIDILGILLIVIAVYVLMQVTRNIALAAAISLIAVSLVLLLGNRKRYSSLKKKIKL